MMGGGMSGFGGFGGFGSLGFIGAILNLVITLGIIVGIVFLVIWVVRRFAPNIQGSSPGFNQSQVQQSPQEILKARYARGEVTRDEYQEIMADLA